MKPHELGIVSFSNLRRCVFHSLDEIILEESFAIGIVIAVQWASRVPMALINRPWIQPKTLTV